MKIAVKTIEGESAGEIDLADAVFGAAGAQGHPAALRRVAAVKRRAGHAQDQGPRGSARHGQEDVRAEGHRPRPPRQRGGAAVPRRRQGLRPGRAQPCASTCRRRCASSRCSTALSAKAAEGKLIVVEAATLAGAQDGQARRASFGKLGCRVACWSSTAPRSTQNFARAARNIAACRCAAAAGRQRLRHPAPRHAGADQAMP